MTRKLYLRASECVKHICVGVVLERRGETWGAVIVFLAQFIMAGWVMNQ